MFQGIFKSVINDANKNYIFGTGSIPIQIKSAQLATFADGTTKQQGYQVAEVNKLISTMLTGWDANGNKPKSMSDNYLELILSCDNGFVVKKRLQFPHIIAWQNDSTPYNIADVYKEFSVDNWLKADDFENPDITLVVEPTDEILTTSTATPPEATTTNSGRFYLYYRNLPVGVNRVHIDFHIKTKTEPIDFDLEVFDGLSWKDAQTILASDDQAKINVLLGGVKDVYNFTGAEGNFDEITMYEWSELYQQIISLAPTNKFTHDLYFYIYDESELNTKITELEQDLTGLEKTPIDDFVIADGQGNAIAKFRNGFIKTKNFDSEEIVLPQNLYGATDVFVSAMIKKTEKMGLSITINGPAGYPDNQISDARSMAKLFLIASGYRELSTIWNTKNDITIKSKGNVSGTHLLHSTVFSTDSQGHYANQLTDYYTMLGGKTGTWNSPSYNMLGAIIKGPDDILFSAWLRRNAGEDSMNNRWKSMKILMDIAFLKVQNPSADISTFEDSLVASGVNSAQVLRIPNGNPVNYELFDFFKEDSRYSEYAIYGYSSTTQLPIASTTKVITAITVLDFISDLEKLVEIQSSDIIPGSTSTNPEFTPGEKFTVRELLLSMMLPSSNAAANALARYVGSILILNKY